MTNSNLTKYAEIGVKLRQLPPEAHISSHEWEELVQKLCSSDDDRLREIGNRELYELYNKRQLSGSKQ
jgi:hypothetical protein